VIFRDRLDEFATGAFEAQAVDYLLKPFGEERVQQALEPRPGISLRYRDAKTTPEPDHTARSRDGCARLSGMSVRETRMTA